MMKANKSDEASPANQPNRSSQPRQYVEVNDLRSMLKLGLGLHTIGDPQKRLDKALNGLARLTGADAFVATAFDSKPTSHLAPSVVLMGGKDTLAARAAATRIGADYLKPDTSIGRLIAKPQKIDGRVFAMIERGSRDIYTILRAEISGRDRKPITWISIHRRIASAPFLERERRMVELFHSQSAWLLLQIAEK